MFSVGSEVIRGCSFGRCSVELRVEVHFWNGRPRGEASWSAEALVQLGLSCVQIVNCYFGLIFGILFGLSSGISFGIFVPLAFSFAQISS